MQVYETAHSVKPKASPSASPTYIDVFAGCGGLSLGLERSGWQGLFAIEKDRFAFATLTANFLEARSRFSFAWPNWLERRPWTVEALLTKHKAELRAMQGTVDLLAGGPPCQGFSSAGRRRANDPRNVLLEQYLGMVEVLKPRLLLIENVRGFTQDFKTGASARRVRENFAAQLIRSLSVDYHARTVLLRASDYGVPQTRSRFFLAGVRRGSGLPPEPLSCLESARDLVLRRWGLGDYVTAFDAISDLEIGHNELVPCDDSSGFEAISYREPLTPFQVAMRDGFDKAPSDTRLARHAPLIRERFATMIELCRDQGRSTRSLPPAMRKQLGLTKMATRVLDPGKQAPTVTSMPDDLIHYSEPRTLTVRENARLQTFPDWFVFRGKYTTGGHLRRVEVPRFTQVANAVPPLLAEILGECLRTYCLAASGVRVIEPAA
jgi:DNA (cytosine-5)-methyltransferase 1